MAIRVIFDTDIGADVDDCLALGVLLGSPEIEIVGITCVYGDVALRSRMVRKLLALRGRADIPGL
jgi:purine nucleosidase